MERKLYLLRHAKSDWSEPVADFERPLNERGRSAAGLMGRWIAQHGALAQKIVSSSAKRAEQTACIVCTATGYEEQAIDWDERIYEASPSTLLDVLSSYADGPESIMLIGHNPGFESLVRYLGGDTVEQHEARKLMPTAALAQLDMPSNWNELIQGCASIVSITRPKEIA